MVEKIGDSASSSRTARGGGGVAKPGNDVPPWWRKTCAIVGEMGIRDTRTMEMVTLGRDAAELQDGKGRRREE